jgi:hypothetical protein
MAGFGGSPGLAILGGVAQTMRDEQERRAKELDRALETRLRETQMQQAERNLDIQEMQQVRLQQQQAWESEDREHSVRTREQAEQAQGASMAVYADLIRDQHPDWSDEQVLTAATSIVGGGADVLGERTRREQEQIRASQEARALAAHESTMATQNLSRSVTQRNLSRQAEQEAIEKEAISLATTPLFRDSVNRARTAGDPFAAQIYNGWIAEGNDPRVVEAAWEIAARGQTTAAVPGDRGAPTGPERTGNQRAAQAAAHNFIQESGGDAQVAERWAVAALEEERDPQVRASLQEILNEIRSVILNEARAGTRSGAGSSSGLTPEAEAAIEAMLGGG